MTTLTKKKTPAVALKAAPARSEEHTSELQSHSDLHSFPTRRSSDLPRFGSWLKYPAQKKGSYDDSDEEEDPCRRSQSSAGKGGPVQTPAPEGSAGKAGARGQSGRARRETGAPFRPSDQAGGGGETRAGRGSGQTHPP